MVTHPERPKAALINRRRRRRKTVGQTSPEPTRGMRGNGPQAKFHRSALVQSVQGETRVRSIRPHRLRARQVKPDQPGFEPKQQREGRSPAPMRRKVSESGLVRLCRARTRVNFRDKPVQGAGEERGWRLAQRVGTLKAFRGAPPEGLGVPAGTATEPRRGDGTLLLVLCVYLCAYLCVHLLL